ncbi:MAG: DEAD/DEAH box helicase [Oscillospiraceae bacterium]|nr:DEAD/DEAH box helicase [Oscillospiraceae bacterium]
MGAKGDGGAGVFDSFAPFIKEFIYRNGWEELRAVQVEAARSIFLSEGNALICSKTASGKTEAAFFPVLSILEEERPECFGAIYLAPLKTLINDQFKRIGLLLAEAETPLFHWHGDVSASHKRGALKRPRGILQITPESLEGMMVGRRHDLMTLFHGLRFVILDEVHFLAGTDRGNQVRCILERLARVIGHSPRRIGLSATVGDTLAMAGWLGANTGRDTEVVKASGDDARWRIAVEHFFTEASKSHTVDENKMYENYGDKYSYFLFSGESYGFVYECVRKKRKSLIFLNTREEAEHLTAAMRAMAADRGEDDIFLIHHGNVSKELREKAEADMKDAARHTATCATVTMELGIDVGELERVVHLGAPNSVSSFLQRMGRSGRRGGAREMVVVINEDAVAPGALLPHRMPWDLLKAIAVIQLYLEDKWIEPPAAKSMPFSLLFHQTLCVLMSAHELPPEELFGRVMSLSPFACVRDEDYQALLMHMLDTDVLQLTDEKTLILGLGGERIVGSHRFLATFRNYEEYTVMHGGEAIGTVTSEIPVGDVFSLAGYAWEVTDVVAGRRLIMVRRAVSGGAFPWPGSYRDIHTGVIRKIRSVLASDAAYGYLRPKAADRLARAREAARSSGMTEAKALHLGGGVWCLLPWLGTASNWTLRRFIKSRCVGRFGLSEIEYGDWYYIRLNIGKGDGEGLIGHMRSFFSAGEPDLGSLVGGKENPAYERYDEYIPQELIRRGYIADKLRADEIREWLAAP